MSLKEQYTVLVVEDEKPIRKLVATILKRAGYCVLEAADPNEAAVIWAGENSKIDLLLSDIALPGGSGPELAKTFLETKPSLKVLFTSGNANQMVDEIAGLGAGAQVLQKPYAAPQLLKVVEVALGGS